MTLPAAAVHSTSNHAAAALPGPSRSIAHHGSFSSGRPTDMWLGTWSTSTPRFRSAQASSSAARRSSPPSSARTVVWSTTS